MELSGRMFKPIVLHFGQTVLVDLRTVDSYRRMMLPELGYEYGAHWVVLDSNDAFDLNLTPSNIFGGDTPEGQA